MTRAEIARAVFAGASLKGTDMTGAYTYLARFDGTDLTGVKGLTQAQLDAACGDGETTLPEGLSAPASWPCAKEDEQGRRGAPPAWLSEARRKPRCVDFSACFGDRKSTRLNSSH